MIRVVGDLDFSMSSEHSLDFDISNDISLDYGIDMTMETPSRHSSLLGRDEQDQHPINAITGLVAELVDRPSEKIPISYIDSLH